MMSATSWGTRQPPSPEQARLRDGNPLAQGLVFAGIGNCSGRGCLVDYSRNGHTGMLVNGTTWGATGATRCLVFDGSNDRVDCATLPVIETVHTVIARLTLVSLPASTGALYASGTADNLGAATRAGVNSEGGLVWQSGYLWKTVAAGAVAAGGTYVLGFSYDGGSLAAGISIYRDGVLQPVATARNDVPGTGGGIQSIGGRYYSNAFCIPMRLEWLYRWARVLTAGEVAEVGQQPYGLFSRPVPRYWLFGGAGATAATAYRLYSFRRRGDSLAQGR